MINKRLEQRLIKAGYSVWIQILESCETDKKIVQIRVDKKKGFTDSPVLNCMIRAYLKKLNVKIVLVNMKKEYDNISKNKEINKCPCGNVVHTSFKKSIGKNEKKEIFKNYKYPLISIDDKCYVICPECSAIVEVKDGN